MIIGKIMNNPTVKVGKGIFGAKMAPISPRKPPIINGIAVLALSAFPFFA
jgi:hypothetical protein